MTPYTGRLDGHDPTFGAARGWNVTHEELAPGSWWTTNNMREAIPGVPTPLTWSIWLSGSHGCAADMMVRLGLAPAEEAPGMAAQGSSIVYGRPVACVGLTMSMMSRMPGADPEGFAEAIFGIPRGTISYTTLPPVGPAERSRFAATAATQVEETHRVARDVRSEWEGLVDQPPTLADAAATVARGVELYQRIYTEHLVMTSLSSMVFGEVAALAARVGKVGFERRLVTGYGGMEETEIAKDLWQVASGELSRPAFIRRHGYHGPLEGEVSAHSWREMPDVVDRQTARYRSHDTLPPSERLDHQVALREQAEIEFLQAVPAEERADATALLARARSWIPTREVGKGGFLMGLDVVRAGARVLGADLAARGLIADPDDIFMLTYQEIGDLPPNARERSTARAAIHTDHSTTEVPSVFEGTPERLPVRRDVEISTDVHGVPVSPGIVSGPARVILDPSDADPVEPGEILVCETTDPSWVSLFLDAAALVIDVGQVMSHGAIIARELGIPCVIDTKNGTRRLRAGMVIEVNGDTGVVRVLDEADVAGTLEPTNGSPAAHT